MITPASTTPTADLAVLTQALRDAAGLPSVLVYVDSELGDDTRAEAAGCHPSPVLAIGPDLVSGNTKRHLAAAAAHAIAHLALGHAEASWKLWIDRALFGIATVATVAVLFQAPLLGLVLLALGAVAGHVVATRIALHRREEYAADACAIRLLDVAGLAGADAMRQMLTELAAAEDVRGWWSTALWAFSNRPPAHRRRAALIQATRTGDTK